MAGFRALAFTTKSAKAFFIFVLHFPAFFHLVSLFQEV